jgi:hypothetical protein
VCHRPGNPNGAEAKTKHPRKTEGGTVTGGLVKRVSPAMVHAYFEYMTGEYPGESGRLMRWALESGEAERLGLDRGFITSVPAAGAVVVLVAAVVAALLRLAGIHLSERIRGDSRPAMFPAARSA